MELRVLRYFLAVAREQNFSKAADAVHITQPSLSRQIMDLEEELGSPLFVRSRHNRAVLLTEAGQRLYNYALEIVALADKTVQEFQADISQIEGDIYIGAGETESIRFIAKTAKKLSEKYPRLRYHFFSGNAESVRARLDKGLLDFAIFIGDAYTEQYNYITLNSKDRWGIWTRKDSPLAAKKGIAPEDLKDVPLFLSSQAHSSNEMAGWFGSLYEKLNIAGTYNLIYNASIMVEEGLGCAVGLDRLLRTGKDSPLFFVPLNPPVEAHLILAWQKSAHFSRAANLFLEELKNELKNEK
ncbi:MAG: LysR family transcriptional regulator [Treponema sp.]